MLSLNAHHALPNLRILLQDKKKSEELTSKEWLALYPAMAP